MSQCYAPNAVPVPEYGPCNTSEGVSLCCTPGQICLTNGLCANGQGEFYSGACTDKTYKAAICPSFCMGTNKFVVECEDSVIPNGGFCCDFNGSGTCCGSASNALNLPLAVSSTTAMSVSGTTSAARTNTTVPDPSSGTASTMASSISGSTATATSDMDTTFTNTVGMTVTSTLVHVPSRTPSSKPGSGSNVNPVTIAVGVTIPVVVSIPLITLAILYLKKWRKRRSGTKGKGPEPRAVDNSATDAHKSDSLPPELDSTPSAMPELGPSGARGGRAVHRRYSHPETLAQTDGSSTAPIPVPAASKRSKRDSAHYVIPSSADPSKVKVSPWSMKGLRTMLGCGPVSASSRNDDTSTSPGLTEDLTFSDTSSSAFLTSS